MATIVISSSILKERSRSSMQFFVTLIALSNVLIITGKLRMDITTTLFVLEAMAERMEREAENPYDANTSIMRKSGISLIGLLRIKLKKINPSAQIKTQSKNPYRIFEIMI